MTLRSEEPCEVLPWDSDFFGFTVARVSAQILTPDSIRVIDEWCLERHVKCLYFLASSADERTLHLAETNGYRHVDNRVTLSASIGSMSLCRPTDPRLREARASDLQDLRFLAALNHQDTRYFQDPGFSRERCEELYRVWITQGVEDPEQDAWVAVLPSAVSSAPIAGYVTTRLKNTMLGEIGLLGVDSKVRRQGIGQALVDRAVECLRLRGAQEVRVVTQGRNRAALLLYQERGFRIHSEQHSYHKWYRPLS